MNTTKEADNAKGIIDDLVARIEELEADNTDLKAQIISLEEEIEELNECIDEAAAEDEDFKNLPYQKKEQVINKYETY